jgi:mycothiol synthase
VRLEFPEATGDDAGRVADLIHAHDAAFLDAPDRLSPPDVLDWLRREGDARLVVDGDELVGFVFLQRRGERYGADGFVHPRARGRGVGTAIVEWIEVRARELASPEVRAEILSRDDRAACLLRGRGFAPIRSFFRMVIDLESTPPRPDWPEGFAVASLRPGEEPVLHSVHEDAFEDHWGHSRMTFDEWITRRTIEHDLCFLVRTGDEAAAAAECRRSLYGMGWVGTLGTRREYRRRGLAGALLRHCFRELYARGARRIGLGVDAENATGATRLYERAGMRVAWRADLYAKRL